MNLKECYDLMNEDYYIVFNNLKSEKLIERIVLKFPYDTSFSNLKESLSKNDYQTAFRSSHTLKGLAVNLGFQNLYKASSELTEILRNNETAKIENSFSVVETVYNNTIKAITEFQQDKTDA